MSDWDRRTPRLLGLFVVVAMLSAVLTMTVGMTTAVAVATVVAAVAGVLAVLVKVPKKTAWEPVVVIVVLVAIAVGGSFGFGVRDGQAGAGDGGTEQVDEERQGDAEDARQGEGVEQESRDAAEPVTTTVAQLGPPVEPECPDEDGSSARTLSFTGPPPLCIDPTRSYLATVETTQGDFEITLDARQAPLAVNSFVFLARWRYYEGVVFYRAVPDFVIQIGGPTGPTEPSGGPGYTIENEPPPDEPFYPDMSVVMAGATPESDDAHGALFFVVTGSDTPNGEPLAPEFSRMGHVTAGQDVVRAIEATGNRDSGVPAEFTVIERVTIAEQ
jgi:cyclophilin family peptidyl-prolyl cis-trans isomerase